MSPSRRMPVNKFRSARNFRRSQSRTKAPNMQMVPRGGFRL